MKYFNFNNSHLVLILLLSNKKLLILVEKKTKNLQINCKSDLYKGHKLSFNL